MGIIIRDYRPGDGAQVVGVFRDSNEALRKSRGGLHPDAYVDGLLGRSDLDILSDLEFGARMMVAEVRGSGEIAGMGAISNRWIHRLSGSTYSRSQYVRTSYQRGKRGVHVGSMIRKAVLAKAESMGFRKVYGFSTPGAIGFHSRFGARFFPAYNRRIGPLEVHYYEIELRPSFWNGFRFEPYLCGLMALYARVLASMRGRKDGWPHGR